jgi:hypothetical protein
MGFSPWDKPSFTQQQEPVPEAKASFLPVLNVRAKARTYLRKHKQQQTLRSPYPKASPWAVIASPLRGIEFRQN